MAFSPGLVIGGKYRLERPLASGGMGALWVARHTQLGSLVAMKFMDPSSATSTLARARFEREARSAASLKSPHVVAVQDYGLDGEAPYLVMELLQGEDLRRRLNREKRLPLDAVSRILAQTAKGLRVAHDAKLVHRDLKPANVFLARVDDEEVVKILDFGIAKEIQNTAVGESTKTGELMGSPHYMSPEQVRALKDIDHRSDLWSLSVIVFRAVTGRLPFSGEVIGDVIGQILADPVPRATQVAPDLPPALDAYFDRGFSRDRERRFQSAREMADAFSAIVAEALARPDLNAVSGAFSYEPPPRSDMTSLATMHDGGAASRSHPSLDGRPPLATLPPPMYPNGGGTPAVADTGAPLSGALGPTGGPVIHTAPPPPPARPAVKKWAIAAGALTVCGLCASGFLLLGGSRSPSVPAVGAATPATSAAPSATPAPSASPPSATSAAPTASAATPPAEAQSAEPAAAPEIDAAGSPAGTARPAASARAASHGSAQKKKPAWGF